MKSCIYQILNLVNGKFYIGHSQDYDMRWFEHERRLRKNRHENQHLQSAYNKYGSENFEFIVIELVEIQEILIKEQYWITSLNACNKNVGYNINPDAIKPPSQLGRKHSKEIRDRISNATTGISKSAHSRKPHSENTKQKISLAHRNIEKWPCANGYYCKCDTCRRKRNHMKNYPQDYRDF